MQLHVCIVKRHSVMDYILDTKYDVLLMPLMVASYYKALKVLKY